MYKRKKMMGGYGYKKAQSGTVKFRAKNKNTGAIRTFDTQEAYDNFLLDSDEGADFVAMGRESGEAKKPAAKKSTPTVNRPAKGTNTGSAVSAAGKKVSRTPKEGMFYLKDEKGNFVFYPQGKGPSMRTAAEKMLPGSAGKVSQGTVDDIFMEERPDQMKKAKTKETPKIDVKRDDDIIMKSKEVKFDSPSKPKADGSKAVAKSKVDAAKAKQAKKTQRATDRAAKKAKAPSMRAEKRNVRQNTRQQVQDIKREGRQERKAIRRGMAESGVPPKAKKSTLAKSTPADNPREVQTKSPSRRVVKTANVGLKGTPEGNKGKGLRSLPKEVRNKIGFKRNGGKKGKMKDRRR